MIDANNTPDKLPDKLSYLQCLKRYVKSQRKKIKLKDKILNLKSEVDKAKSLSDIKDKRKKYIDMVKIRFCSIKLFYLNFIFF